MLLSLSGVAGGVGSWRSEGINSFRLYFSTALMSSCVKVVSEEMVALDRPVDILTRGMQETL